MSTLTSLAVGTTWSYANIIVARCTGLALAPLCAGMTRSISHNSLQIRLSDPLDLLHRYASTNPGTSVQIPAINQFEIEEFSLQIGMSLQFALPSKTALEFFVDSSIYRGSSQLLPTLCLFIQFDVPIFSVSQQSDRAKILLTLPFLLQIQCWKSIKLSCQQICPVDYKASYTFQLTNDSLVCV